MSIAIGSGIGPAIRFGGVANKAITTVINAYSAPTWLIDPSPSTVFIDPAGSASSAYGDVVGLAMENGKNRGRGLYHLVQEVELDKPLYQQATSGGYLAFDGVRSLLVASCPFAPPALVGNWIPDELTMVVAGNFASVPSTEVIFSVGDEITGGAILLIADTATKMRFVASGVFGIMSATMTVPDTTTPCVWSVRVNSSSVEVSRDGVKTLGTLINPLDLTDSKTLALGGFLTTSSSQFANVNINKVFGINRYITDAELLDIELSLAVNSGFTLPEGTIMSDGLELYTFDDEQFITAGS